MLRWFHALMPREERFFDLFAQHSRAVVAGAEALRAMLEGGEAIARNYQVVMDREHDADDATREVLIAVRRTFITPFDRGNIRDLITSMDNSIDQMQKTAKSIKLFDVKEFTPQHVQAFLNAQSERGHSAQTVRHHRAVLRCALEQAMRWQLVDRNVAKLVTPPRLAREPVRPPTTEQARTLILHCADDPLGPLFQVAIVTGMRQGNSSGSSGRTSTWLVEW